VRVPWGLDLLEGTVVGLHGRGSAAHAVISLVTPGSEADTPSTVVFPLTSLEQAKDAPSGQAGSWLSHVRYEHDVTRALRGLFSPEAEISLDPDSGFDLLVRRNNRVVLVVVKYRQRWAASTLTAELRRWHHAARSVQDAVGVLLVTQAALPFEVERQIEANGLIERSLGLIRWRSPEDNQRLEQVMNALLSQARGQRAE
jgi:hypothetical protein